MKILTINTHSLQESNGAKKLDWFIQGVLQEMPDVIAMQEVSQTMWADPINPSMLEGQFPVPGAVTVRADNYAAEVAFRLRRAGLAVSWAWLPVKIGYGRYDEGIAVISLGRAIRAIDTIPVSKVNDYQNWRTRKVLGVRLEGLEDWFYTVHMGWWNDTAEPFLHQWKVLNSCLASKRICGPVWLMGDFNAPDCAVRESYDTIRNSGWQDTYLLAEHRDRGITVPGVIDGWEDRVKDPAGMRLDYIWCSEFRQVVRSCVIFNGENQNIISDHFGVLIETKE